MTTKRLKHVKRKSTIKLPKLSKIKLGLFKSKTLSKTGKFIENIKTREKSLIELLSKKKKSPSIKSTLIIPEIRRTSVKGDLIETKIDELYNLISKNGKISTSEAAAKLNVKIEEVENWAQILSEHNLIEIEYPAVGKTIMIKK
jgi:hypothetical protein